MFQSNIERTEIKGQKHRDVVLVDFIQVESAEERLIQMQPFLQMDRQLDEETQQCRRQAQRRGPYPVAPICRGVANVLQPRAERHDDATDQDPEFHGDARLLVEPGAGVVQVGLLLFIDGGPGFGGVPLQVMLSPTGLLPSDVETAEHENEQPCLQPPGGQVLPEPEGKEAGKDAWQVNQDGADLDGAKLAHADPTRFERRVEVPGRELHQQHEWREPKPCPEREVGVVGVCHVHGCHYGKECRVAAIGYLLVNWPNSCIICTRCGCSRSKACSASTADKG